MRKPILSRYMISFAAIAIILFISINTYGANKIKSNIINQRKTNLYNESDYLCKQYGASYFAGSSSIDELRAQLTAIDTFLDTEIVITNPSGTVLIDTKQIFLGPDFNIKEVDPLIFDETIHESLENKTYFDEPMLTVINPIVIDYKVRAYLIMFHPHSQIDMSVYAITDVLNICLLIFLLLLILLYIYLYIINIRPLKQLVKASIEYSSRHFEKPIELTTNDEYQDLADALTYIGSELTSMDDYQKKFVGNISHDFRSPLTSIKGYAEAMLDGTIPYENQAKYLSIILFETERLTKLTSNLLTLNSFENNGVLLDITSFDINQCIKQTAASFEGTCKEKKITFKLEFSERELFVDADMSKIQQVLYNLIDNAIKFSHSNSSIRISTNIKGEKVFIAVKDRGVGIPKENIKKIWERFYKTDISRGKDKKGTGLGLSIAKEIITTHNENINVISTEGVGTEFIFSLPKTSS